MNITDCLYNKIFSTLLLLSMVIMFSSTASGFNQKILEKDNIVGIGLWYGMGVMAFDTPPDSISNAIKGYNDIMPTSVTGGGPSLGVSYSDFGVNIGWNEGTIKLNSTADIYQTPGNTADDVFVNEAVWNTRSISILYQPLRYVYLGYGRDMGTMEIVHSASSGIGDKKYSIESDFVSLGFAFGFDPEATDLKIAPIVSGFIKYPLTVKEFYGPTIGFGVGVYY